MLELLNKLKELQDQVDSLEDKKKEIEKEFSRRLGELKDWELKILGILSGNLEISYKYTPEDLLESLIPEVKNIRVWENGNICFDIRVIGETDFPKTWISTGIFSISELTWELKNIEPEYLEEAESRKRDRITEYKEEIEELKRLIEEEENEISSIRAWIRMANSKSGDRSVG